MSEPNARRPRATAPYLIAALPVLALTAVARLLAAGAGAHHAPRSRRPAASAEAPDPLEAESFAQAARDVHHANARAPRVAARAAFLSPGAPSDQQVRSELAQERAASRQAAKAPDRVTVDAASGEAIAPPDLPLAVQELIAGGNAIRDFPYVYGGGHSSFVDDAYDCSGSVSYALAAAGLIRAPETSGQLMRWGDPGPGRYITVFATVGHTFMYVDGVWFDTAGRAGPYSTRWLTAQPSLAGYVERHPPGL